MAKQHYFVSVNTKEIRDVAIDDNQVEYEVIADGQDIKEIQEHFEKMEDNSADGVKKMFIVPFNELSVDDDRDAYRDQLHDIYQKLYDIGTEDTKRKISELGIIN